MSDDGGALEGNPSRYVAQYDFSDPQEGELAFKAGDELLALPIPDVTDWLFAKHGTEFGKIPANFVQIMPESAAPSPSMRQFSNDDNNELVRMHAVVSPKSGASTRRSPGVDGGRGSVSPRNRGESSSADRSPVHGGRQSEEGADDQLHETNNDHRAGKEDIVSPRTRAAVTAVAKKRSQRFAALSVSPPTGAAATGKKQDSHAKDTVQFELPPGPLGIRVSPFGANIAVECVTPGSSGDNIGLQQHDLIVAINDQNLSGLPKERAMALFASFQNEEKRTLVVSRKSSSKGSRRSARHSRLKRVSSSISMQKPLDSRSAPQSQLQQLPGESLLEQIERVVYVNPFTAPANENGTLAITTYQVCFLSVRPGFLPRDLFCVPHGHIDQLELVEKKGSVAQHLLITCKDMRRLCFKLPRNRNASEIIDVISHLAYPKIDRKLGLPKVFALSCKYSPPQDESGVPGAQSIQEHVEKDNFRLGVYNCKRLRVSRANQAYSICPSYPSVLVVAGGSIVDDALADIAQFRSSGRIPVFCWMHRNKAMLWRCSQPCVGVQGKRNANDEELFKAIATWSSKKSLLIVDCRPKTYAMANMAKGKGYEKKANYPLCDIVFLGIGNIHDVRNAHKKMAKLVNAEPVADLHWQSSLESTGWLAMIRSILIGSVVVAKNICLDERSVVVHCSDGWDRTAQVVALAQVLMDPYYRTLDGLQVLIEREWMWFGHQFQQRCGHGVKPDDDSDRGERSPIFVQFLDCLWQLTNMYHHHFEFSPEVVLCLAYHTYSCRFGNFIGDTHRMRSTMNLGSTTPCVWSYLRRPSHRKRFINAFYNSSAQPRALLPTAIHVAQSVQLWSDYFLRWIQYPRMLYGKDPSSNESHSREVTVTQQFRKFDSLNNIMHDRDV